jgi:molybdopterin-guanine dinucleotide biosynthesis protein A
VVAADLPGIGPLTFARLAAALVAAAPAEVDGALLVDAGGRRQYLSGVWRLGRLAEAIGQRPTWHGAPLRELLGSLRAMEVTGAASETADVDTPADWERWQS